MVTVDQIVDQFPHYTYVKNGYFYFTRRVPSDLEKHYRTKRIVMALRTKACRIAKARAQKLALKLEEYWSQLRWSTNDVPASRFMIQKPIKEKSPIDSASPTLSEAKKLYLRLKGQNKGKVFLQTADRSIGYVTDLVGDKPIATYQKSDANQFRDSLFNRNLSLGSVKRIISVVRSIINFTISENGLDISNPFNGIYLGDRNDTQKREPIPDDIRIQIQRRCLEVDDQARWLIALISDTGMRLSEAVGLHINDFNLDGEIPFVQVQPHKWRRLKTESSTRKVPLYGASYWAARQIVQHSKTYAFPKYCNGVTCNSNTASASLNKWMSNQIKGKYVIHGFRHGLRDRLRVVECPFDVVDQIGGWKTGGVGQGYGNGYLLNVVAKWMDTITNAPRNNKTMLKC